MWVDDFPLCCGALVLSNFPYENTDYVEQWLKNRIKENIEGIAFLTAILNEPQNEILNKVFTNTGFKKVSMGYNHKHPESQPLHIYVYNYDYQPG